MTAFIVYLMFNGVFTDHTVTHYFDKPAECERVLLRTKWLTDAIEDEYPSVSFRFHECFKTNQKLGNGLFGTRTQR